MRRGHVLSLVVLLSAVGCKDPDDTDDGEAEPVDHIVLSSGSRLLGGVGETAQMQATAFDADGDEVPTRFTWVSDDPDIVSVTPQGLLEARIVGSTRVHAEADDVSSAPSVAWVATVPDGALLFDDDQLVGGPTPLGDPGPFLLGSRYQVVLADVAVPAPGTIVLAQQDAPVGGKVVSASDGPDGVAIELELVGLPELFVDVAFESHETVALVPDPEARFTLAGFECETDAESGAWPEPTLAATLSDGLTLDKDLTFVQTSHVVEHALLRVHGYVRLDVAGPVDFPLTWEGSLTCKRNVSTMKVPAPGVLGVLLSIKVPLGIGFRAAGSFEATTVRYNATGFARAGIDLGFEYTAAGGFTPFSALDATHGLRVTWDTPALEEGATVKASLFPYVSADLKVGPTLADAFDIELAQLKAGVIGEYELTAPVNQVHDANLASKYEVRAHGELDAGSDYKAFLEGLGLEVSTVSLDPPEDSAIFKSPTGTSTLSTRDVVEDEPVTLTTNLDPASVDFVDGYNVVSVHVWREGDDEAWSEVAEVPATVAEQTEFPWDWTPTAADEALGTAEFAWYVETTEMPDVLLEIEPDSREATGPPMVFQLDPAQPVRVCSGAATGGTFTDLPLPITCTTPNATITVHQVDPNTLALDAACSSTCSFELKWEIAFTRAGTVTFARSEWGAGGSYARGEIYGILGGVGGVPLPLPALVATRAVAEHETIVSNFYMQQNGSGSGRLYTVTFE